MPSFLDELLDDARRRVDESRGVLALHGLRERAEAVPSPPSFRDALAGPGVAVIAEVKRASPSKGDLAPGIDAVAQAGHYVAGGVAAISVLTEPVRFKGSLEDLRQVAMLGVPTIRKDFVVDEYQVWEARSVGAAAILLIVAALDDDELRHLSEVARLAGLDTLVEVHDEAELARAAALGADIIGVNARDLRTFDIDRDAFGRLRPLFPTGAVAVAESGIRDAKDVLGAGRAGADAVLVGETLVTSPDPARTAAELVDAGRQAVIDLPAATPLESS